MMEGQPSIDVCRSLSDNGGCYPTIFTVNGASYYKICGKSKRHNTDACGGVGTYYAKKQ